MPSNLRLWERRVYSQSGEDGVIQRIFACIGAKTRYYVEFGAKDGFNLSNTALLRLHRGWRGLLLDPGGPPGPLVKPELVTPDNIAEIFTRHGVPAEFDLLSIDIDGNEYWVWKALVEHRPRVVVIEYNIFIDPTQSKVAPYDASGGWDGTPYHGAGLGALRKLGEEKGYALVHTDSWSPNAFFVLRADLPGSWIAPPFEELAVWSGVPFPEELRGREWVTV